MTVATVRPAAACIACLLVLFAADKASAQAARMPGDLDAGLHAVGFRIVTLSDPSRPVGPKAGPEGRPVETDRSRKIAVHLWYPAAGGAGTAMTMAEYLRAAPGPPEQEHRQMLPRLVGTAPTDAEWSQYLAQGFIARRHAPAAPGAFPLLVGMLRPVSIVTTAEYLASHGYVVAFVQRPQAQAIDAEGLVLEALLMSQDMRDMEVAIGALRSEPFVDRVRLGAIGFSGDGVAQLVLAMRHPDIDAIAQIETGYFAPIGTSSYQDVTAYDPSALRAPMLFLYSENLGRNTDLQMAEIEKMRYAPRFLLYLGEPRMTHWDFATEGVVSATLFASRASGRAGVLRAYSAAQRYQLTFFDAFVKRDAQARQRLDSSPAPAGPGPLIEARARPAVVPAISRREFRGLVDRDMPKAMQQAREGLARDPLAALFDDAWLNGLGYELLQRGQPDKALDVFTLNVEAHPASVNAYDSLSEALEGVGRNAAALEWAEKGLAAAPRDASIPAAQRKALEDGLRARVARLKGL
jgi:tetratricopeptide (TPR) repeat protein